MKIDVYCHVVTPKYRDGLIRLAPPAMGLEARLRGLPALTDMDLRFRVMDEFGDYAQIITQANPPVELVAAPGEAAELSRIANDEMAELVARHPKRFASAGACLPLNDVQASLDEIDRVVSKLGLKAIQVYSHVNGKPLDDPEFLPIFEKMAGYDLPILLHPARAMNFPDYTTEKRSLYDIWHVFGWPYETAAAMTRIVFSGLFDRWPNLKIVTHHLGGMVPYFEARILNSYMKMADKPGPDSEAQKKLKHDPYHYYTLFYGDTALNGSTPGLECGLAFFGIDRVVFATDTPFDSENGARYVRETVRSVESMTLSSRDKRKIYEENARRIFRLQA